MRLYTDLSSFGSLAGFHGVSALSFAMHLVLHRATILAMVIGAILATIEFDIGRALRLLARLAQPVYAIGDAAAITVLFALSILSIAAGSYSPFLYFRF